jgi:glutaredoxin-like YruB-family protein
MSLEIMTDPAVLDARLADENQTVILGFFGAFSEASREARPVFERCCAEHPDQPALLVDVGATRGVHAKFGVSVVPTVLAVRGGQVQRSIVGVQAREFYERALLGERAPTPGRAEGAEPRPHRVTVYVTDTCPWCTRVKTYLREHDVSYDEIDVSRDESAARKMVARSGQQGVPQVDIDGSFVVGFDKPRIDALLGLGRRG